MNAAVTLGAVSRTSATVLAGENQKSGPIGLAVILVLCVVSYLLFKSMSRHMRKVREEVPDPDAQAGTSAPAPKPATTAVVPDDPEPPADGADPTVPQDGAAG